MEPRTDYDVDLHTVRSGDTYASVSQKYYDSNQYAESLRVYNGGAPIDAAKQVEVPPLAVIRKFAEKKTSREIPSNASAVEIVPAGRVQAVGDGPDWGPPAVRPPGLIRFERYRVPREGMTFRDVALDFYGHEREWQKVDNKQNFRYRPDEKLARGTELFLPVEDVTWR